MKNNKNHIDNKLLKDQHEVVKKLCADKNFRKYLLSVALKYSNGDHFDAQDIVGDAIERLAIRLWKQRKCLDDQEKSIENQVKAYLWQTIMNFSFNYNRKKKEDRKLMTLILLLWDEDQIDSFPIKNYYSGLKQALPEAQFEILVLISEGKSNIEISSMINKSQGNVGNTFFKAKRRAMNYFKSVDQFELLGEKITRSDFRKIANTLKVGEKTVGERTVVEFYNSWKNNK